MYRILRRPLFLTLTFYIYDHFYPFPMLFPIHDTNSIFLIFYLWHVSIPVVLVENLLVRLLLVLHDAFGFFARRERQDVDFVIVVFVWVENYRLDFDSFDFDFFVDLDLHLKYCWRH